MMTGVTTNFDTIYAVLVHLEAAVNAINASIWFTL